MSAKQFKSFVNSLIANATWDGLKQLWGPAVLAFIVALWQKLRHGSLDWLAIAGLFIAALVISLVNFRHRERRRLETPLPLPPEPKLKIHRAIYGAGPGRDIDVTERLKTIERDALFIPIDNNLVPYDPAIGVRKRLLVEYSYGSGVVERAHRLESTPSELVSLTLPEDTQTKELLRQFALWQTSLEEQQDKQQIVKNEGKSLRDRVFNVCGRLKLLLDNHGPRPNPYTIPIVDKEEYTRIYNDTVQAWDNKFQADYWKNYKETIVNLRHDLALESLTDEALDRRLMEADTVELCDVTVTQIDKGLRSLASKLP